MRSWKTVDEQVTVVKVLILLPGSLLGPDSEVPDNGIKQIPETGGAGEVTSAVTSERVGWDLRNL